MILLKLFNNLSLWQRKVVLDKLESEIKYTPTYLNLLYSIYDQKTLEAISIRQRLEQASKEKNQELIKPIIEGLKDDLKENANEVEDICNCIDDYYEHLDKWQKEKTKCLKK